MSSAHRTVRNNPRRKSRSFIKRHFIALLYIGGALGLTLAGVLLLFAVTLKIPDLQSLENRVVEQSTDIYDRTGETLLYDLNTNTRRTVVPLSAISPHIQHAIIAVEDRSFYTNYGIRPTSIVRAILINLAQGSKSQGGSTITQQVVKQTILTADKSYTRKIKEWILALKLTRELSKDQILEIYLNQTPFGGRVYGAEQASQAFFGKHASEIDLAEAAYLAGVLPAPSYYSPYGNHRDELEGRKTLVLKKMLSEGYITEEEYTNANAELVAFLPPHSSSIVAAHFVFYVEKYLEEKYGEESIEQAGWKVITSIDTDLQLQAEATVNKWALTNSKNFNASNAALVATDPNNGQILAMVGSRDYFDTEIDGAFNVALAGRQPGSTFKPFAYAEALTKGYTPDTVVFDVPTQFSTACDPLNFTSEGDCYSPGNYDDQFRGPMTLRNALAQSINIPAVKTLYLAGIPDTIRLAKSMGVTSLTNANRYGLTLVLGGGEVSPLEMTNAYGTFANNGTFHKPIAVLKIIDKDGKTIEDNTENEGTTVLSASVAQDINSMLSDNAARGPLGESGTLSFSGHDVAAKTGTTNNYRDAWTIGYTPNIAVGVWAGNNDNTPMVKRVSGLIVGPMWHEFMEYAISKRPNETFSRSDSVDPTLKPILRGQWQTAGTDGNIHEILYWVNKDDPRGPVPQNPSSDGQFRFWDPPVIAWAQKNAVVGAPINNSANSSTSTTLPPQNTNPPGSGGLLVPITLPSPL